MLNAHQVLTQDIWSERSYSEKAFKNFQKEFLKSIWKRYHFPCKVFLRYISCMLQSYKISKVIAKYENY